MGQNGSHHVIDSCGRFYIPVGTQGLGFRADTYAHSRSVESAVEVHESSGEALKRNRMCEITDVVGCTAQ